MQQSPTKDFSKRPLQSVMCMAPNLTKQDKNKTNKQKLQNKTHKKTTNKKTM